MDDLIVKMVFGSHLYGTDTPESDQDFKGVAWPTRRQILLGHIPKSINTSTKKGDGKNSAEDVDTEIYSLHYFMKLACEGQTVAIDMMHAPPSAWITVTDTWRDIARQRARFYTRNLHALVGYARRQAAKYGIKGSRLAAAQRALGVLWDLPVGTRLVDVWDLLPTGEYLVKRVDEARMNIHHASDVRTHDKPAMVWEVCGKILLDSASADHYIPMLQAFVKNYGERARMAEKSEGIDWKAMSHAVRAAVQVQAILRDGGFEFPLREAAMLKTIKSGALPYGEVAAKLEGLIDECEALAAKSTLPEKVDVVAVEDWLCQKVQDHLDGQSEAPNHHCPWVAWGSTGLQATNIPEDIQARLAGHVLSCGQPGDPPHPGFQYDPLFDIGKANPAYLSFRCCRCMSTLGPYPVRKI